MRRSRAPRYCTSCGTQLAADNPGRACAACQVRARELLAHPPRVPGEFWHAPPVRDALARMHMGRVIAAYRHHRHHGGVLRQQTVAAWAGITQPQLSRIETGSPLKDLDRLAHWARLLAIPPDLLWFTLPPRRTGDVDGRGGYPHPVIDQCRAPASCRPPGLWEDEDMNRRELLRLLTIAGTTLAAPRLDWDRLHHAQTHPGQVDHATVDQLAVLNTHLWNRYNAATVKHALLAPVQQHIHQLVTHLHHGPGVTAGRRLHTLVGDMFQLCGEIDFDGGRHTDAAHCYTLATTACQEAGAFDLWACALVRHAYLSVYERQFDKAAPMLELAATIAQRGDGTLSTRHWVHTVHANALAGLGDLTGCQRALDRAGQVRHLTGQIHNGGWLRFDGSRLAEERGTCYVELHHPTLAETALLDALAQGLSVRRRGGVLTDLALVAAQRRDLDQLVMYADAALDAARQTRSGVLGHRLHRLQAHLRPLQADRHVRHVHRQITALTGQPT